MTRVKICCIADEVEAELALAHGADAIGLVTKMPSGPGVITDHEMRRIARWAFGKAWIFVLTSQRSPLRICEQARGIDGVRLQLVDKVPHSMYAAIRSGAPHAKIVQVIHVRGREDVAEAVAVAPLVDEILLDSGNPDAAVKELGGTGRTHDWTLSRAIVESVDVPVWLAGGLHAENVAEAITKVRPFGVDICSGVRELGALSPRRLQAFFAAVRV
ncbi:MAG: phosphoribosylanthranilate isomerase [Gemmatimonadaceae bacterium]|nr:phosphoribosylanthranilate isomerase [Gemmatimonadaceae bacterium]MCW5826212.1 phosphoribosylanthranilate isomerase [Gemmatimonadaceae bacterium]